MLLRKYHLCQFYNELTCNYDDHDTGPSLGDPLIFSFGKHSRMCSSPGLSWMDESLHHFKKTRKPVLVGIYRESSDTRVFYFFGSRHRRGPSKSQPHGGRGEGEGADHAHLFLRRGELSAVPGGRLPSIAGPQLGALLLFFFGEAFFFFFFFFREVAIHRLFGCHL